MTTTAPTGTSPWTAARSASASASVMALVITSASSTAENVVVGSRDNERRRRTLSRRLSTLGRCWGRPAGEQKGLRGEADGQCPAGHQQEGGGVSRVVVWTLAALMLVSAACASAAPHHPAAPVPSSRDDSFGSPPISTDPPPTTAGDTAAADQPMAPPPAVFDGPPAAVVAPPAQLQRQFANVTLAGGTWAVVVGINDYPGSSHDLRYSDADADDTVAALRSLGVSGDHIVSLRDGGAPAATISRAADWLVAHSGPDAVAVFFYAGHVRKLSSQT